MILGKTYFNGAENEKLYLGNTLIYSGVNTDFVMSVKTDNAGTSNNNQFTIPTTTGTYNYDVTTQDGQTLLANTGDLTITFPTAGTYDVNISGTFPKIFFANTGDSLKILSVANLGIYGIGELDQSYAFQGCRNLSATVGNADNLNLITTALEMFRYSDLSTLPTNLTLDSLVSGNGMFHDVALTSLPSAMELPNLVNGYIMFSDSVITSLPSAMELPNLENGTAMFARALLTDLPSGMTLPNITAANWMFEVSTINTTRYSQLLIDMAAGNTNSNVPFHGGNSKYNASGQTARNALVAKGWSITDGGLEV